MSKRNKATLSRPPRSDADAFIDGAGEKSTPPAEGWPWQDPSLRSDVHRTFNLRLSEPTKVKLQWLAARSPESMHQIALDAVEAEIDRRIREQTD